MFGSKSLTTFFIHAAKKIAHSRDISLSGSEGAKLCKPHHPPRAPEEVVEEPAFIQVTLRMFGKAPGVDFDPMTSPMKHVMKSLSIAPSYREAVAGQRVKAPLKNSKTSMS